MIQVEQLEKHFGPFTALQNINVSIAAGSVTALIGPSGSGKSTLLRCINLLETPQSGSLQIGSEKVTFSGNHPMKSVDIRRIRQQTGMIFQNFQLFPHLTVIQNVAEGLITVLKWPKEKAYDRALELLEQVGMKHKADAWPGNLSGGQQQRVAIARALAPSPSVLLCDEPTSALDPELSLEVVAVLRDLAKQGGVTMLMATHDLRLAANLADQVIFLESGSIIESGTAQDIFMRAKSPRTQAFISTLTESNFQWEI